MKKEYADIIHRCFRCGWCKLPLNFKDFNCPSYLKYRFESFSSGGRLWLIRAWMNGEIQTSERFAKILFSCVTCKNCVEACAMPKIRQYLVDMVIAAREDMVEQGVIPPGVRDYLKAVSISGNAYKMPQEQRAIWADGLDIPLYSGQEYLFYVGDVGSYDEVGKKMARSVAMLLKKADISFGILASDEITDGNEVKTLGEAGLFEQIASQNIEKFKGLGVRKIITLSPHAFNSMKNEYPKLGGNFDVYHYTQVLNAAIKDISMAEVDLKVTYHDPCYLGRWNNEYWAPRSVLRSVPGLELVEMDRNMQNALCCGGGGGNFFTDILGTGPDSSSRVRVKEAIDTGASVLAVACPICYRMLSDAVKAEGLEDRIEVRDIADIVNDAVAV